MLLKSSSNKFEETTLNREGNFQIQEKDNTEFKMKDKKVGKVSKDGVSFSEIRYMGKKCSGLKKFEEFNS